ncbi:MAG: hypothetical protein KDA41_21335 [Planctomycetales bacterium]|nr:hypothetical protein [Planctomycetales bacterium]
MTKRKQKRKQRRAAPSAPVETESQSATAITVFWTTTVLATALSQVAAGAARCVAMLLVDGQRLVLFSNLFLMLAAITGLLALILQPLMRRARSAPPPAAVSRLAVVISLSPMVLLCAVVLLSEK